MIYMQSHFIRRYFWIFLLAPLYTWGQSPRLALKVGVTAPVVSAPTVAVEYQIRKKHSIEAKMESFRYEDAAQHGLFNGEIIFRYAEISIDTIRASSIGNATSGKNTQYIKGERPAELLNGSYPVSAFAFHAGWRISMPMGKESKWLFWQQPGLAITRLNEYKVESTRQLTGAKSNDYYQRSGFAFTYISSTSYYYEMRQSMRPRTRTIPGIEYNMGITRNFGRRLLAELRLYALLNPLAEYRAASVYPARFFQANGQLQVGWRLL
mgnify:CR=1 FL=1